MKTRENVLRVTLSCAVLLSIWLLGSLSAGAADTRFIPVDIGQTFTFNAKDAANHTWVQSIVISGLMVIPPTKIYYAVDTAGGGRYETTIVRSTSTGLYQYGGSGREYLLWQKTPVGTTWTYTDSEGRTIERKIEAVETVTVPAGTYTECLKIHHRCTNCPGTTDRNEWVKPGFFLVKWIDYGADNAPVVYQLKSWTP
jgi:hypothetical protein